MTKTAALFSLLFLLLLGTAQRSDAQPRNPDRTVFAPEGEEFTVRDRASLSLDDFSIRSREYSGRVGKVRIYIVSDQISEKEGPYDRALSLAAARKAKGVPAVLNGLKARKFIFDDENGASCELIAVRTKKRKYVFQTFSDRRSDPDSRRFFSDIRINTSRINPPVPDKIAVSAPRTNGRGTGIGLGPGTGQSSDGRGTGDGSGSGWESGSGSGARCGAVQPAASGSGRDPAEKISPLKILAKPKANYTDAARLNEITGTVNLRVVFLANGTIGGISPISGLPYGLTEMAIGAARSIRFEPAKKNGVPCTAVKMIPYNFTLY
jgi:hypothetical protein